MSDTGEAIREAAFELYARQGYERTSVDEIVAAAGVSRSTFFRMFGSKDAVIFPDHESVVARVEARLQASHADSAIAAVADAVKIVLFTYVAEGERARERYRLISAVPTLRDRELVGTAAYQRLFRRFISGWGDGTEVSALRAELMAAAVVAAHNRVLRQWLREECPDPQRAIEDALGAVARLFEDTPPAEAVVVAVPAGVSSEDVRRAIARLP
jgi:AcrR family transcriptional regulator